MWEVCAPIASCGASHNIPSQLFCIFSNSFSFLGHVRMLPLLEGASRRSTKVITISDTELEYLLKSNQQSRNTRIKFSSSGLPSPFCNLPYLLSKAFFLNTSCRYQLIFTLHEPPNLGFWKSWRLVASLVFTLWSSGTRVHLSRLCICHVPAWAEHAGEGRHDLLRGTKWWRVELKSCLPSFSFWALLALLCP